MEKMQEQAQPPATAFLFQGKNPRFQFLTVQNAPCFLSYAKNLPPARAVQQVARWPWKMIAKFLRRGGLANIEVDSHSLVSLPPLTLKPLCRPHVFGPILHHMPLIIFDRTFQNRMPNRSRIDRVCPRLSVRFFSNLAVALNRFSDELNHFGSRACAHLDSKSWFKSTKRQSLARAFNS